MSSQIWVFRIKAKFRGEGLCFILVTLLKSLFRPNSTPDKHENINENTKSSRFWVLVILLLLGKDAVDPGEVLCPAPM